MGLESVLFPYRGELMTEFIEVASLGEIPPGERKRVEVRGELITLFNLDGELFAIYDRCPHKKTPRCYGGY